ncbi:MAG: hypothetical protein AAGA61_03935, partial [Pseudomonadota bacterium]
MINTALRRLTVLTTILWAGALTSCASSPPPCAGPQSKNLDVAFDQAKSALAAGCAAHFDRFHDDLM